jgi:hypothetical protein
MRKRHLLEEYVIFVENMLIGQRTKLIFDDYTLIWFSIDNGIGQGDLLSMTLYLFYNVDLLDIAKGKNEKSLGYVDDSNLAVIGKTFTETHRTLKEMMEQHKGGYTWSKSDNSGFEGTKLILMDFSQSLTEERPPLILHDVTITPQQTHKFIGLLLDQELRWNHQATHAIAKATKWTLTFCRLARPAARIWPKIMRQLYNVVAVPKMTYAADVWYTPIYRLKDKMRNSRSVNAMKKLASIKRMATLAITGALCTTATDVLDLHANLLPVELLFHKVCHRAAVHLATLPDTHPLHAPFR